ncbi:hypothetical protein MKX01_016294, partial [Papaver californicum]
MEVEPPIPGLSFYTEDDDPIMNGCNRCCDFCGCEGCFWWIFDASCLEECLQG